MDKLQIYGYNATYNTYQTPAKTMLEDVNFSSVIESMPNDRVEQFINFINDTELTVSEVTNPLIKSRIKHLTLDPDTNDISNETKKTIESYALSEFFNNGIPIAETQSKLIGVIMSKHEDSLSE